MDERLYEGSTYEDNTKEQNVRMKEDSTWSPARCVASTCYFFMYTIWFTERTAMQTCLQVMQRSRIK